MCSMMPGLLFIPESPRWLAKMGRTEDFESSLQVLRGFGTDISIEVNEIKSSILVSFNDRDRITCAPAIHWHQRNLFYSSNIFESAGVSSSNVATFGLGVIQVIATGISTWLADKAGRRVLLIVSSSGMTLSLLLVAIVFYLEGFVSEDSNLYTMLGILSLVGLVLVVITFSMDLEAFLGL
ncbi:hypothetical protein SLA2020_438220 [Shorea laevis]